MFKLKKPNFLTFFLAILIMPILLGPCIFEMGSIEGLRNVTRSNDNSDHFISGDLSSEFQLKLDESEKLYFIDVKARLNEGENPETPESVFVYWSEREPDFPSDIIVQTSFKSIPVTQVVTPLGGIETLKEINKTAEML